MLNNSSLEKEITLEECNHTVHMSLPMGVVRGAGGRARHVLLFMHTCCYVCSSRVYLPPRTDESTIGN